MKGKLPEPLPFPLPIPAGAVRGGFASPDGNAGRSGLRWRPAPASPRPEPAAGARPSAAGPTT